MKNLHIAIVLVILLAFSGCKNKDILSDSIQGTWELTSSFNGWTGEVNYPPGNGNLLEFGQTTYAFYSGAKLVRSGVYKIEDAVSSMTNLPGKKIVYDNQKNSIASFIEIREEILTLSIEAYDAGSSSYVKIPDR